MTGNEGGTPAPPSVWARISALQAGREPFAVATVVARRAPVSAHLGDRAIVYADGRMEGFVGGACSREIVRRQALEALATRRARLVAIRPDAADDPGASADRVVVPMTCASEGAVDVYVEPVVRPRTLVVAGATPVAEALARLGRAMRYDVVRVVDAAERQDVEPEAAAVGATVAALDALDAVLAQALAHHGDCAVVVASQGHYDESALETTCAHGVGYVGLVASRKRGQTVRAWLEGRKVPGLDRLCNPAGLDLGGGPPRRWRSRSSARSSSGVPAGRRRRRRPPRRPRVHPASLACSRWRPRHPPRRWRSTPSAGWKW
ncbi:MAG: XdhC family protein [Vicinamibacterales bacterium]